MADPSSSLEALLESVIAMSPEDRYHYLKRLNGNDPFRTIVVQQPGVFREFMWFEKRAGLKSNLVERVSIRTLQNVAMKCGDCVGTTRIEDLLEQWADGDEFWRFEEIPGDSGYALVRAGEIVDYCTQKIICF